METKNDRFIYYLFFFILSFIGGYLEYYSMLIKDFYTFMQTGNLLKFLHTIFEGNFITSSYYLISLLTFIFSFVIFTLIKRKFLAKNKDYKLFSLILLLILIVFIAFVPKEITTNFSFLNALIIILLTLYGVILVNSFITFFKINFVPTMMTNNIRQMSTNLTEGIVYKEKEKSKIGLLYIFVIFAFILGIITIILFNKLFPLQELLINSTYSYSQNIYLSIPFLLNLVLLIIYLKKKSLFNNNL